MRKQARLDQAVGGLGKRVPLAQNSDPNLRRQSFTRLISTTSARLRSPQKQSSAPVIPITASTVTTNITADAPREPSPPKPPGPSTAEMQRQIIRGLSESPGSITDKLAMTLRRTAKSTTQSYVTYGLTETLFESCAAQANYTIPEDLRMGVYTGKGPPKNARQEDVGVPTEDSKDSWWFKELGLEPTFSVWSQVCFLHMYILTVKLRTLDSHASFMDHQRYLLEHFSNIAEDKMGLLHGMSARGVRNKYLKDLFIQWRGLLYAYDQGLAAGDTILAGAIWRNIWKADEDVDWTKVALVVGFMRRCIAALADVDINTIASSLEASDDFWKGARVGLTTIVNKQSPALREPFKQ